MAVSRQEQGAAAKPFARVHEHVMNTILSSADATLGVTALVVVAVMAMVIAALWEKTDDWPE